MARSVVLLAGPSGSGKSRLVRVTGAQQLRLDDFYKSDQDPDLPWAHGRIDWDDVRSWKLDDAARALGQLLEQGWAEVPEYSIVQNRPVGSHRVELAEDQVLVAEGIFAPELLAACRAQGVPVVPVWLDRPRATNFSRRLRRDLSQHRKPPAVLVRRGLLLWRTESALRRRVLGLGFRPLGMRAARQLVLDLQSGSGHHTH